MPVITIKIDRLYPTFHGLVEAIAAESDMPDHTLLFRLLEGLKGAAKRHNPVVIPRIPQVVAHLDVDVIRS